ncbi:MAG: YchJ family protein [Planctomycetes bacterium]|nr:YchJ family protein [Planctomycetota bacterium]
MECPCGSGRSHADCCEPYLTGAAWPETAEALMRARYSAFATGRVEFIRESHEPGSRDEVDDDATRQWSQSAEWQGIEVLATDGGGPDDDEGTVEFVAHYSVKGTAHPHHEVATFQRGDDGRWYFVDGVVAGAGTYRREQPKVGRNDPCPCGSGRKYKKCHGGPGAAT